MVLQWHYGGGSSVAVVFLVWCGLLSLDPYGGIVALACFDDYMGGMLGVAASDGVFVQVCVNALI